MTQVIFSPDDSDGDDSEVINGKEKYYNNE